MSSLNVVITAAGSSKRMAGVNKVLLNLGDRPVLVHAVEAFARLDFVKRIVVSAPPELVDDYAGLLRRYQLSKVTAVVAGGAERQYSIYQALLELEKQIGESNAEYVAVHDAARPLVSGELIKRLFAQLPNYDGVIPGVPVKDTIKRLSAEGVVVETLVREQLTAVQTPQMFGFSHLMEAYREALKNQQLGTDDASLVELVGGRIKAIPGEYRNLKITTSEDLAILQSLLNEE